MKAQIIRILDVAVIGPVMIYGGYKLSKMSKYESLGYILMTFGVSTIGYNLRNYLIKQQDPNQQG
jgi:hypothetical protein